MKNKGNTVLICLLFTGLFFMRSIRVEATTYYVNASNAVPASPFTSWSTAATNIQAAVSLAVPGDLVLVTNGIYQNGQTSFNGYNRVYVNSAITLQSANGPAVTIIAGTTNSSGSVRCVYLANGATLSGFTLTNGVNSSGGGVYCQSTSATVTNCAIQGNAALSGGGGSSGTYINCVITGNTAYNSSGGGGGIYGGCLTNCVLAGNSAGEYGGGAYQPIAMVNCTVVNNNAEYGGGIYAGGSGNFAGSFANSIFYFNTSVYVNGPSNIYNFASSTISNCCAPEFIHYPGCIPNLPGLVDITHGNYHLQIGSPCIDAGNSIYAPEAIDLDGNPRIFGASVDIGAYENQFAGIAHFVSLGSANPVPPYTNWWLAATDMQDAINIANPGEAVVVSNGIYKTGGQIVYDALTNRVVINNQIMVESLNGPAVTTIAGNYLIGASAVRCVYMTNNATLMGFTLSNGAPASAGNIFQSQSGGGVWSESTNALINNCIIRNNRGYNNGGGAYSGTLTNCLIFANNANYGGGAAFSTVLNCVVSNNLAGNCGGGVSAGFVNGSLIISNNAIYGGGVSSNILLNSTLTGNWVSKSGGGAFYAFLTNCSVGGNLVTNGYGGGALYGALAGCTLTNNVASNGGGACSNVLNTCLLANNTAQNNGGAVYSGYLSGCYLATNGAANYGGGSYAAYLTNCILTVNGSGVYGGGSAWGTSSFCIYSNNGMNFSGPVYSNVAVNCIFANSNGPVSYSTLTECRITTSKGGGATYSTLNNCYIGNTIQGDGADNCILNNCTITHNGFSGNYGAKYCYTTNCIIYSNIGGNTSYIDGLTGSTAYSCTTPLPPGPGNFTNAPIFLDAIHQQSNSPCIDAGINSAMTGSLDIDGRPRIVNGTVDVGATEFQGASVEPFIVWLAYYGLPDDGSVDYVDSDGTGMNNWQKWLAGLNPTNPASVLKLSIPSTSPTGLTVTWQSVTNVTYYVQNSTNLNGQPAFYSIQSNIVGQAGTTSFTDTSATNGSSYFYRIGVQ